MKSMRCAVLLLLVAAVLVDCFPRERDAESVEDERDDIPLPSVPVVAVPANTGFGIVPNVYSFFPDLDLVSRIRGLVTRLRSQIGDSFSGIDWSKGNTTSTTKVVDGHIVTVNETSIKDEESDLVLHVKVIDVKPTEGAIGEYDDSSETAETTSPKEGNNEGESTSSTTDREETLGNEIPKQPEEDLAESLDYNPEESGEHLVETREYLPSGHSIDDVDMINEVDNLVEVFHPIESITPRPISLHGDILINKLMSDQAQSGGMVEIPTDVEVFAPDNREIYETVEEFSPSSRDVYESFRYAPYAYSQVIPQKGNSLR